VYAITQEYAPTSSRLFNHFTKDALFCSFKKSIFSASSAFYAFFIKAFGKL